jgi:hypothetical protein
VADEPAGLDAMITELMGMPFTKEQIQERKMALRDHTNRAGAEKILRLLD